MCVTWPTGLFKDLRSLELGFNAYSLFNLTLVLGALRESPLLENLCLLGHHCDHPDREPPVVALPSLRNCNLLGVGAIFLTWYISIPASTNPSLGIPLPASDMGQFCPTHGLSLAPCFYVLNRVSAISFSIRFDALEIRMQNNSGGALSLKKYYYGPWMNGLSVYFFFCWRTSSAGAIQNIKL